MNKKKTDYSQKYGRALKHSPNTEQGDLLIQGKDNSLKRINPLDVKYEGSSFGLILDLYHDLQVSVAKDKAMLNDSLSTFISTLQELGYNTSNIDLNALIGDIRQLKLIIPTKQYNHVTFVNGYVNSITPYGLIIEQGDIPEDYNKGYWTITDDGKWLLDQDKYNQYWGLV